MGDAPFRILPAVTDRTRPYWTAGRDGVLRFQRCGDCGYWLHPPSPLCPECLGRNLAFEAVSGRATVHTFTVNEQGWMPVPELPFVLAIVELPEQAGLRLSTVITGCRPHEVEIGMPVEVVFEAHEDDEVWLPLFTPVAPTAPTAPVDAAPGAEVAS